MLSFWIEKCSLSSNEKSVEPCVLRHRFMFAGFVCYRIVANCKHKCQCELTCSYLHKCLQPMYCKLERHLFKCYCISMEIGSGHCNCTWHTFFQTVLEASRRNRAMAKRVWRDDVFCVNIMRSFFFLFFFFLMLHFNMQWAQPLGNWALWKSQPFSIRIVMHLHGKRWKTLLRRCTPVQPYFYKHS